MPRQLPVEIRRHYAVTPAPKNHEMGPGWLLKCDVCGERSHVAYPPKGQAYSQDLIRHLLDHVIPHVPSPSPELLITAINGQPKLRVVRQVPKAMVVPPIPIGTLPNPTGYYRIIREGKFSKVVPASHIEYQGGLVQAVGASHTVVVQAVNSKHARTVADGLIDRHIRPLRPTRSWREKLST